MDDDVTHIEQVALDLIDLHGADDAARIARERADLDEELGDGLSARKWREIAGAIEHLAPAGG